MSAEHWIVAYIVLSILFGWIVARQTGFVQLLSAYWFFSFPAAVYSLGAAINYLWFDVDLSQRGYLVTPRHLDSALPLTVLALVTFNLAYIFFPSARLTARWPRFATNPGQEEQLAQWGVVAIMVGGLFTLLGFGAVGLSDILNSPYGTIPIADQSLIHMSMFLEAGAALAGAYLYRQGKWFSPLGLLVGLLLAAYLGFTILIGKRAVLLYFFLGCLVLRQSLRARLTVKLAAVGGLALSFVLVFLEVSRDSPVRSFDAIVSSFWFHATTSREFDDWTGWVTRFLSQGDNLGTLGLMMERIPDFIAPQHGWTYLEAVFRLIPGFLWRGVFNGGLSSLAGENLAFFYLAEAYLNFGLIGAFIVPAVLGFLLRGLDEWYKLQGGRFIVAVIFALLAGDIAYLPRLDLGSVLKSIVYRTVFVLVLYEVSRSYHARASRKLAVRALPA